MTAPKFRFHQLACGRHALLPDGRPIWSHDIAVCFDPVRRQIAFGEDIGHGGVGGTFTAGDAIGPQWARHFAIAGGEWLLPFVRRLADGEAVLAEEVLRIYRARHGHDPYSFLATGD
jgi:hypothetical protein